MNIGIWMTVVLAVMLLLNIIAVGIFSEAEFWFAILTNVASPGLPSYSLNSSRS